MRFITDNMDDAPVRLTSTIDEDGDFVVEVRVPGEDDGTEGIPLLWIKTDGRVMLNPIFEGQAMMLRGLGFSLLKKQDSESFELEVQ